MVEVIFPRLTEDTPMNIQHSMPITPLRARMISDMTGRNLGPASQTSHLRACKRFAAWLGRSPETATPDDVKCFQQHLIESGDNRRLYLLRTNHHTLTKLSMWQKLMTSTKYRAYRPNAGKADPALSPTAAAQQVCQFGSNEGTKPKSP